MIAAFFRGRAEAEREAHKGRAWLGWHIAALFRANKLPKLKDLMPPEPKRPKRPQTFDEMLAIARRWAARGVGSVH